MANIEMSLDDLIKKDKPEKKAGAALGGNRGGRGFRGRGGGDKGGRPRFNDNKGRNDLFRARKGANAIQKRDRGDRNNQKVSFHINFIFCQKY